MFYSTSEYTPKKSSTQDHLYNRKVYTVLGPHIYLFIVNDTHMHLPEVLKKTNGN